MPLSAGNKGRVPHCPDFLWRLVTLMHSMCLSLMKGAHADLSSTAWQEIGVKPGFACPGVPWGLSGIPQHSTHLCCYPDRSLAYWRDLRFLLSFSHRLAGPGQIPDPIY